MVSHAGRKAMLLILALGTLSAEPIVTYTVGGSAGNWSLDFTVDNTTNQELYFFGVLLPVPDVTGSPTGWYPTIWPTWSNSSFGGSSTVYNNNWVIVGFSPDAIGSGNSLGGFDALVTTPTAPASIRWFAFTCDNSFFCSGNPYTGGDNFNTVDDPGFEGTASIVPEPSALLLTAAGITAVALRRRHSTSGTKL
ncbi:MAG: PEP-CTERM sorting domain-containing protein [Acidobacteriia bacterium]|nr:PEP-CTERM sorting domain-containing protein [Terriglobia bacterium]